MKTLRAILSKGFLLLIMLGSMTCSEPEQPRPEITDLTPDQAAVGAEVVITGKNLSAVSGIIFGDKTTVPASRTDTEVHTSVPAGLAPGVVSVTVKTEGGTSNAKSFTVLPSPPELNAIEPNKASAGMEVKLRGKYFTTATVVNFGSQAVTVFVSKSDEEITLKVPEGLEPGAVDVTVTAEGGISEKSTFTVIGHPLITSVTPRSGPAGRLVTIEGAYLEDAISVSFGVGETEPHVKSASLIEATVPENATSGEVKVVTPGGTAIFEEGFVVKAAPKIEKFDPPSGIVGATIIIDGEGLDEVELVVKFGAIKAIDVSRISGTRVTAKVPESATTGKITVETDAGSDESETEFVVIGSPIVATFDPGSGGPGKHIQIIGYNFIDVSGVKFNNTNVLPSGYNILSTTLIDAVVPIGATTGKIQVLTPAGTGKSDNNFTVLPLPTVTSFMPGIGPTGSQITITGTHFDDVLEVYFGVSGAVFQRKSSTSIQATVPSNASTGKIKVVTQAGEAISAQDYVVKGAPEITSFSPSSGIVGTPVIIKGTDFDAGAVVVKFGTGKVTEPLVVTATQITAKVPANATSGYITVETAAGADLSTTTFTVIGSPSVTSFSPLAGVPGIEVHIIGQNFIDVNNVRFNNIVVSSAGYKVLSATEITANVPAGASSGIISVSTPAGTGNSANNFMIILPPTIASFEPQIGPVGRKVIIAGTFLDNPTKVTFAGIDAPFNGINSTSIEATVPANAITGKIKVVTPGGEFTSAADFTVKAPPEITDFTPSGFIGDLITINGKNFVAGTLAVKIGNITATDIPQVTDTKLTVKVPVGATTGKISVETSSGSALSVTNFTIIGGPSISVFSPLSGGIGIPVTITGTNFVNVSAVKFNTTNVLPANYDVISPSEIKAEVPAGATTGKISVTTPGGTISSSQTFTVLFPPVIGDFTPKSGLPGSIVNMTGSGFVGVTGVSFNDVTVPGGDFNASSPTTMTAKVPSNATSGKIKVTNAQGAFTSLQTYYVTPFISGISPTTGAAGSLITITGTNLEGSKVRFNSTEVTPVTNSSTSITVNSPPALTGAVDVRVVNLGGTSNNKTFTATAPIIISEIIAAQNIELQLILFKGSNLQNATKVQFGSIDVDILTKTSKVVTAQIPDIAKGTYPVRVVTPNGNSNDLVFTLLEDQLENNGGVNMVNGASIVSIPPNYVPPVANSWINTFDDTQSFTIIDRDNGEPGYKVQFKIGNTLIDEALVTYDLGNNFIEFTLNGVRYAGVWTHNSTGFDSGGNTVCFANMTLISAESGKQLQLAVIENYDGACPPD